MSSAASHEELQELVARQHIRDVIYRYCRGIDRLDLDLVRACYHPDATDSHGSFDGPVSDYIDWVEGLLAKYDRTFHFIGNLLIDFDPDTAGAARAESYGIARHEKVGGPDHANLVTGFRFIDDFRLRNGAWRIQRRVATTEWTRIDRESDHWPLPESMLRGSRDRSDPLYGPAAESGPPV